MLTPSTLLPRSYFHREMAGGKKVDPKANMSDKLKVNYFCIPINEIQNFLGNKINVTTSISEIFNDS